MNDETDVELDGHATHGRTRDQREHFYREKAMRRVACVVLALVVGGVVATGMGATKSADEMVKEIEGMQRPSFDTTKRQDPAYVQEYMKKYNAFQQTRLEAMKGFVDAYPDDPRAGGIRNERWMQMSAEDKGEEVQGEIDAWLKGHPGDVDALYSAAGAALMKMRHLPNADAKDVKAAVDRFIAAAPKDNRGAMLLYQMARDPSTPEGKAMVERILKEYPESLPAKGIKGSMRQAEAVGKPFELSFTDAISGKVIDMHALKGKVVVVDFWATWCGPCVAAMPANKEKYAKYKGQGVEFIGVSLDNDEKAGGLKALKEFVAKNGIEWPQYYEGKGWESEFSLSWGITGIPTVFVVDAEGNLAAVNADSQLDVLIPELLAKRDQGK